MLGPREAYTDPDRYRYTRVDTSTATGWVAWQLFAAMLLILLGTFQATVGFIALFKDGIFVAHRDGLLIPISYNTWGWIHLVCATIALVTGVCLLLGQMWARIVGAAIAFVDVIVLFGFLDSYPWLATTMIVFFVVTIFAIVVHGGEVAEAYDR